jgi:hypothetical protein
MEFFRLSQDWRSNAQPAHDTQQPFDGVAPLSGAVAINTNHGQVVSLGQRLPDHGSAVMLRR